MSLAAFSVPCRYYKIKPSMWRWSGAWNPSRCSIREKKYRQIEPYIYQTTTRILIFWGHVTTAATMDLESPGARDWEFAESFDRQVHQFSSCQQYRHRNDSSESCESQEVSSHIYIYLTQVMQVTQVNLMVFPQALEWKQHAYILEAVYWHVWLLREMMKND